METRLVLTIDVEGRWFQVGDQPPVALGRRRVLHRILSALSERRCVAPGAPLLHDEIFAAGWPGERALRSAIDNRIRVAIFTLRRLGLDALLRTGDRSYWLDPRASVVVAERPAPVAHPPLAA